MSWTPIVLGSRPAVVLAERENGHPTQLAIVTVTANGPQREHLELEGKHPAWTRWRALALDSRLLLVSEGFPGSLRLAELVDGRVVRSVRKPGSFPGRKGRLR